jgi:hypothetical protein
MQKGAKQLYSKERESAPNDDAAFILSKRDIKIN